MLSNRHENIDKLAMDISNSSYIVENLMTILKVVSGFEKYATGASLMLVLSKLAKLLVLQVLTYKRGNLSKILLA